LLVKQGESWVQFMPESYQALVFPKFGPLPFLQDSHLSNGTVFGTILGGGIVAARKVGQGSHVRYVHLEILVTTNFQPGKNGEAKAYQVRQFLAILRSHGLISE
jgi:hypothetical protein